MKRRIRQYLVPAVVGIIGIVCVIGAMALNSTTTSMPEPKRAAPAPVQIPLVTPEPAAPAEEPPPTAIASSAILRVSIPAIALDAASSGETWPRQTENCQESDYCIDPPVLDQVAWYGDPPSLPSENPVLIFGHTSWSPDLMAVFDNLPAVVAGDEIIVTTETGVFTYTAEAPTLVPFLGAAESDVIFGWEEEKLVLVTCNTNGTDATVIVARLAHAELV